MNCRKYPAISKTLIILFMLISYCIRQQDVDDHFNNGKITFMGEKINTII